MNIITRQDCVSDIADKWHRAYWNNQTKTWKTYCNIRPPEVQEKYEKLIALSDNPNPDEVDAIIGNGDWTHPIDCSECGKTFDTVIEVGQAQDYESATAWLCFDCLKKAMKLFRKAQK